MFVIPIEHLSRDGIDAAFAEVLCARVVSEDWIALFNQAFRCYWGRCSGLFEQAPRYWFPPRLQHVCIVTDATRVRPYFQPFNKSSWLLYESDFDPAITNVELAAYQIVHAERMGLLQEVTQAVVYNLSYWLERTPEEVELFCSACRRATRPDAEGFRSLARAMPWVTGVHHEALRPATPSAGAIRAVPQTGLQLSPAEASKLEQLVRQWTGVARRTVASFHNRHARRGRDRAGELCAWLEQARPDVLLTGDAGSLLWDPRAASTISQLRGVLGGIGESAVERIRDDLLVIDQRTRRFVGSLRRPEALPAPHPDAIQGGLCYMHVARKKIAYNMREPGMDRLRAPAPPYERFMLGARAIHEWGHLAVEAGWVPVAPGRQSRQEALREQLADEFEQVCRDAPAAVRAITAEEIARLSRQHGGPGRGLAQVTCGRLPDYQANLLARRYLSDDERETYVRNNVYSLTLDYPSAKLFQRLARYVYEFQYLRFSAVTDGLSFFLGSTWFREEYLAPQILSEARLIRLLDLVGEICDCYVVDTSQLKESVPRAERSTSQRGRKIRKY
jgi:hypothetical protein